MKALIAFIVTMMLALPVNGLPLPKFWNCMQIGFLNSTPIVVVSDIQNGSKNPGKRYKERTDAFAIAVKKIWGLKDVYEPYCSDFIDEKEARAYYSDIVKKANKSGILVYPIEFKWKAKTHVQKKD